MESKSDRVVGSGKVIQPAVRISVNTNGRLALPVVYTPLIVRWV